RQTSSVRFAAQLILRTTTGTFSHSRPHERILKSECLLTGALSIGRSCPRSRQRRRARGWPRALRRAQLAGEGCEAARSDEVRPAAPRRARWDAGLSGGVSGGEESVGFESVVPTAQVVEVGGVGGAVGLLHRALANEVSGPHSRLRRLSDRIEWAQRSCP